MIWAELFAALHRLASPAPAPTPPAPPMPRPSKDDPLPRTGHSEAVLASPLSGFHGEARKLNAVDLCAAARKLGVDPLDLKVIIAVETSDSGFDAENRPTILFEPHQFYRLLDEPQRTQAVNQGLAYAVWTPKGYGTDTDQYPRLIKACSIHREAALKATSWGLGQIMGLNYASIGFGNVSAMVAAAMESEAQQLGMICAFLEHNHLVEPLKAHDWAKFAYGYNGSGYATEHYDRRLAGYFAQFAKATAATPTATA